MATQKPPKAEPENTPIPGGGRWCWNFDLCAWVEVTEQKASAPEATPTEPTPE